MEILIAEDNTVSRMLLEKVLVKLGYKVLAAENGLEAWKLFQQNRVSMVITDWMMPEMDGMALCKKIRASSVDDYTYIIIVTAKDQKQNLIEAFKEGADDYLAKPFDPDELKARIKTGERIVLLEKKYKKLETDLINSRDKLKVVFDSVHEEIVSVDKGLHIVSANRVFVENRGSAFSEIITRPYFTDKDSEKLKSRVIEAFETGKPQFLTDISADKNGNKKYCDISCIPTKGNTSEVYQVIIVLRDVTELELKSKKIISLNNKLKQAFAGANTKNEKLENALKRLRDTQT
ncbi:MAG: response regulator, partial [Deltaproteobacteria bacterium]|nr:response regulator [Deltaproteobacteria bacterium]